MTVSELKRHILGQLTPAVGSDEATAMMREVFLVLLKYKPVDVVLHGDREVTEQTVETVGRWISRVKAGEPFQYVIGSAPFMGMELKVTPAVLIPRPETAQLVDIITDHADSTPGLNVMDIGTGSGCIALALARALPFATVTAVDVSDAALDVARWNADNLHVRNVQFLKADALNMATGCGASAGNGFAAAADCRTVQTPFDVIVSNPPYIAMSEKAGMDARVYDHEPTSALFVPDSDPVCFYRAISQYAVFGDARSAAPIPGVGPALAPGGTLYFEINPLFVDRLKTLFAAQPWASVDFVRDYKGAVRFAILER